MKSTPIPWLVQLAMDALDDAVGLLPNFSGAEERQTAFSDQRVCLLSLAFPVMSVTLQGGNLELWEHLGSVQ